MSSRRLSGIIAGAMAGLCLSSAYIKHVLQVVTANPIAAEPAELDLGSVSEGAVVTRRLLLTNSTNRVIDIERITTSCGCTTATPLNSLGPNESKPIFITFNSAGKPGPIKKSIEIKPAGADERELSISIVGRVDAVLSARPSEIQLISIDVGTEKLVNFSINRLDGKNLDNLVVSSPHIKDWSVTPRSKSESIVSGTLRSDVPGSYSDQITIRDRDLSVPALNVPIDFSIKGQYKVEPENINFGTIGHSRVNRAHVVITGPMLDRMTLMSPSRHLTVSLHAGRGGSVVDLEINSGVMRHCVFRDTIILATGNKKQPKIIIPVYAAIS